MLGVSHSLNNAVFHIELTKLVERCNDLTLVKVNYSEKFQFFNLILNMINGSKFNSILDVGSSDPIKVYNRDSFINTEKFLF